MDLEQEIDLLYLAHELEKRGLSLDEILTQLTPSLPPSLPLESLQAQREMAREQADRAFNILADELIAKETERKKLWGNKFPRVLGDRPPENGKTPPDIHPVKTKKPKTRKASSTGSK